MIGHGALLLQFREPKSPKVMKGNYQMRTRSLAVRIVAASANRLPDHLGPFSQFGACQHFPTHSTPSSFIY